MSAPQRSSSEPLRPTPNWPSPPHPPSPPLKSTSSSQPSDPHSPNSTMQVLLAEAKAAAGTQPPPPPESQPQPPTLQELISQSNTTTHLQDKLITNPNNLHHYTIYNIIGSSAIATTVYNGVYWANNADELSNMQPFDLYVAVKVIDMESQEEYEKLVEQVNKIRQLDHPNLLQVKEEMIFEDKYYVVFRLMDGSLRCLMNSVFTNRVSEELIAIVLKEVLKALAYLHQEGHLHQELNASHIYYGLDVPAIKIGFLATIHERNSGHDGQTSQGNLPVSAICEWAAAPEIYKWNLEYTDKSDVWLVGITAIELVCGGIQVKNRNELERLIAEVTSTEEGDSGKGKGKKKVVGKYFKKMMKKMKVGKSGSSLKRNDENLSQAFKDMLAQCLIEDAGERPTADALLQHDFFKICDGIFDVYYFRNAVELAKKEREMSVGTSTGSNEAEGGNP